MEVGKEKHVGLAQMFPIYQSLFRTTGTLYPFEQDSKGNFCADEEERSVVASVEDANSRV